MLRYSVPQGDRLWEARSFRIHPGGAELNVAADLASLGDSVCYVTALPPSPLGLLVRRMLDAYRVRVEGDLAAPGRVGVYYYEPGVPPRPGVVTYDREGSSFSRHPWSRFQWEGLLEPGGVFLTTGITAALGPEPLAGVRSGLEAAARAGATAVFDVNYRAKLWSPDEARRAILPLLEHVEVLFTSVPDAVRVLGAPEIPPENLPAWLGERFNLRAVSVVHTPIGGGRRAGREADAPIQWRAIAWREGERALWDQPGGVVTIDRLGAGDAYAAGFLWAIRQGRSLGEAVRYGSAMMALKNTVNGDFCPVWPEELEAVAAGESAGVQR
ncbi:hypothetical protein LIP_2006 [Limnochorda pilosa]|uniref:Carbohydrate kinase PfkB domain-containing protein n=2 Tax=Limnochorda pilosa TaxID=1555112 RepID=A0A0K2SLG4_LIMPI|nr:sugar kinase [Limnochorda pilosa]BAS27847.1 hypothetical protein LIP_2006 [Limnochorda pilosa]